ncbi:NMD3 family protein [Pyrolobus fumarii 1A]|uniref:NMD3 family protein n=1 Tax=Pyrolobus fumarii (strain DSM 11204 / 1A) TaxID=694429 RepID=G0EDK6_PYRF1|nr:NMD3-related protein [Pyrolobus fumarii]AEM39810.1 NMD3 family protein [Pyrolobus fumarii 1A]
MLTRCVRCGREARLVDGRLCLECYLEVEGLGRFPKRIDITVCSRCGAYRFEGRWYPPPIDAVDIEDVIREVLKLTLSAAFKPNQEVESYRVESVEYVRDQYHGDHALATVVARLRSSGEEAKLEYRVRVDVKKQLCPQCFKKAGGAIEAILQVRGEGGKLTEEQREAVEALLARLSPSLREYIVDVVEQREGFDLILVDQGAAKAIASKIRSVLGAKVVESWKLVGRRSDGRPKKRLTLSVRLPFFTKGTIVEFNGKLYHVEGIKAGFVYIRMVGSRRVHRLTVEDAWKLLRRPRFEEEKRVLVAAETPSSIHLQALEGSYEYLELPRRSVSFDPGVVQQGREVLLVRHNGRYYVLPLLGERP